MPIRSLSPAVLLLWLAGAGAVQPAAVQPVALQPVTNGDLDALMSLLAKRRHGHVEFVEQQFLSVLNHPLESSGELRYDAPDRVEKRTLAPRPETMVLANGALTVDRGKSHRVVDLQAYPQALPFIESVRATLAGDRGALEKIFTLDLQGSLARWTLTLVPKDPKVKHSVEQVRIDGTQDQLLKVDIRQADGDHSSMTLRPAPAP